MQFLIITFSKHLCNHPDRQVMVAYSQQHETHHRNLQWCGSGTILIFLHVKLVSCFNLLASLPDKYNNWICNDQGAKTKSEFRDERSRQQKVLFKEEKPLHIQYYLVYLDLVINIYLWPSHTVLFHFLEASKPGLETYFWTKILIFLCLTWESIKHCLLEWKWKKLLDIAELELSVNSFHFVFTNDYK